MDAGKKKEIINEYKRKDVVGGVYCVECAPAGKKWIKSTRDLASMKSRFDFSQAINSCPEPIMREAWTKYGGKSFTFTVLENLEKGKDQTDKEYADDLDVLLEICKEKYN